MGGENAILCRDMSALENMNKEAVEFVRGIPVVKKYFNKPFILLRTFALRLRSTKNMPADMQFVVVFH